MGTKILTNEPKYTEFNSDSGYVALTERANDFILKDLTGFFDLARKNTSKVIEIRFRGKTILYDIGIVSDGFIAWDIMSHYEPYPLKIKKSRL